MAYPPNTNPQYNDSLEETAKKILRAIIDDVPDPIVVTSITDPVTVSSITNPVAVSSVTSITNPVSVISAPGTFTSNVTVTANNTDFFTFDCLVTRALLLNVNSVGGGATVSWQGSNDPAFAVTIALPAIPAAGGATVTSTTAVGHWVIQCSTRYVRVRTTAYTSGNIIANVLALDQSPFAFGTSVVSGTGNFTVAGGAAHDAAVSGNPVRMAGRALSSAYTTVSTGDTADCITTLQGVQIIKTNQIPELEWSFACATGGVVNTSDVQLAGAAGAGLRRYLTALQLKNVNAVAGEVVVKDGSTVIWRGHVSASMLTTDPVTFPDPLKTSANAVLNFACLTTAQQVYVSAQGYTAP